MSRSTNLILLLVTAIPQLATADHIYDLQVEAIQKNQADFGHWGWKVENYTQWGSHSNRLIPVYTFGTRSAGSGIDLADYTGKNSLYRDEAQVRDLYGQVPEKTVNPDADYLDQTDLYRMQLAALDAGKKNIILVVFDGMDWQTTQAAAIRKTNQVAYEEGRGSGLHFQDYNASGTSQFGSMVTSPYVDEVKVDVDKQTAVFDLNSVRGGYDIESAGPFPWSRPVELSYLVGEKTSSGIWHAYTDSASSATSMTAGIKSYNAAINVNQNGEKVTTIAHLAQARGYKIGVVTSVPISHATPAAAYSHNVKRHDYQDLTNDLVGVKSISHPDQPLAGVDVLIGAGFGDDRDKDSGQGKNFVPGNSYLTEATLHEINKANGGKYTVSIRKSGVDGGQALQSAAKEAVQSDSRLFGFYGVESGHLPFQTADGDYKPAPGRKKTAETYSQADIDENPNLAEMTSAALTVLEKHDHGFWLMVEAGDVDWANHDNNLDNSIGAVFNGDDAVKVLTDWVEKQSSWEETVLIVTADHGHYLVLEHPEMLLDSQRSSTSR